MAESSEEAAWDAFKKSIISNEAGWICSNQRQVMYPDYVTRKAIPVFVHMATAVAVAEHWLCSRDERRIAMPMATLGFWAQVAAVFLRQLRFLDVCRERVLVWPWAHVAECIIHI